MSRGFATLRALRRFAAARRPIACAGAERGRPVGRDSLRSLAHAESEGAAPGTEWRPSPAESSPLGAACKRRSDVAVRALGGIAVASFVLGMWQFGGALYIHAKAEVAQLLLHGAWMRAQTTGVAKPPWPWADTYPVARLVVPAHRVDELVLEGANGRALAFGPGHVEGSARLGEPGHAIVSAHRDTHFRFLRELAVGDEIVVEQPNGARVVYRVSEMAVRSERDLGLVRDVDEPTLSLVTCYPFDAMRAGGPLRYVVTAHARSRPATRA